MRLHAMLVSSCSLTFFFLRLVPSPCVGQSQGDPFNISNDSFYRNEAGLTTTNLSLKKSIGTRVQGLEHSTPAKKLDKSCFKYTLTESDLRNFHRPKLKKVCMCVCVCVNANAPAVYIPCWV